VSSATLLDEAAATLQRSRVYLQNVAEEQPNTQLNSKTHNKGETKMSTELTAQRAGELYTAGKSVIEVAREHSMTYAQVRKLIGASGTPIRNSSDRLKGRTRKVERA
jgi:transcription antitermination factor NusA-like protein